MSEEVSRIEAACPGCGRLAQVPPDESLRFCICGTVFNPSTGRLVGKGPALGENPFAKIRGARMQPDDNDRTANQYAQTDNINHPEHYAGPIECIDAMIAAYGKEQVAIFCKICAFKYLWRLEKKGDSSVDAGKAQWYLDKYKEMKR